MSTYTFLYIYIRERGREREREKERERERERRKSYPSNPIHFPNDVHMSSSKSLEHNPFTFLKLCYLLDAINFCKGNCFL